MAAVFEKYLIEHRLVFDSNLMTLSNGDLVTALAANETELLTLLMQGIATKQAVIEQVWESKGMVVTEGSYHQLVRALRLKLEEQGVSGSLIKTLPRLGLKFIGTVEPVAEAPASVVAPSPLPSLEPAAEAGVSAGVSNETDADRIAAEASDAPTQAPLRDASGEAAVPPLAPEPAATLSASEGSLAAPEATTPAIVAPPTKRRRLVTYAVYGVLIAWAGVLAWKTFFDGTRKFEFPFAQTVDGVHYFSNGRMEQKELLQSIHVTPVAGSYIYQIGLGNNDWLAVCPKSIYEAPEQCETYFVEKAYH
ncbi:winged helix-turn-helix domain-containing protein [Trinickia sp. YCB016]